MTDTGWQAVSPSESLSTSEAKQSAYRILYPAISDRKDSALMEGSVFLSKLWTIPRPIHSIGGYGAPFGVRRPYNWVSDRDLLTVAEEVYDQGVVETAIVGQSGILRIYLNQPLEPGELHKMVFWNPGKTPTLLPAQEYVAHPDDAPDIWDVRHPDSFIAEDGFIAISYDGARIGAYWMSSPYLGMVKQPDALETAAMLRWMRAPILSQSWSDEVRGLAYLHPAHTLKAWLDESGLPAGIYHGSEGEQWKSAIRQIFSAWNPDRRTALSVLRELGQENGGQNVLQAFQKLFRLDPLLMGRVTYPLRGYPQMVDVIRAMRSMVAELPRGATYFDFEQQDRELLDQVSEQMGIDDNFIANIVRKVLPNLDYSDLSTVDRNNAQVALNIAPFREYLGLRVLSSLLN